MESPLLRKVLEDLGSYTPGLSEEEVQQKYGLDSVVKLASNENPFGPPKLAVEAMHKGIEFVHRYPRGDVPDLRRKLAEQLSIPEDSLVFSNGSDEALLLIALAFLERGSTALVPSPSFSEYRFSTLLMDARCVAIPLMEGWQKPDSFLEALDGSVRVIFLCSPNNPTGTWITRDEMSSFLDRVPENVLVVVDQAYCEWADAPDYPELLRDAIIRPNLVLLRTFSKLWGLAGLRIGYAITSPELAEKLEKVRAPFNVNRLAQEAACAALDDTTHLRCSLENNKKEREVLSSALRDLDLEQYSSQANFLAFRVGKNAGSLVQGLLEKGIIVRHLRSFGMDEWIRVSVGLPEENRRFLDALQGLLP